ncbi:hypothetical protein [Clostridium psychrophilum]|uniref:hypothetical protein n=1 Tax=Clostridium psychrophilum TaxID=132926 RepID=UPI001C0B2881|nr:hypothetical protein [Clostridium psychrophilum]MBU3183183.1 hypothetical protein [Clostridium psychrophilum]
MFNKYYKNVNEESKTIYDTTNKLTVRCKIIIESGTIKNYLININDHKDIITILLDKDGNTMFSQIKL